MTIIHAIILSLIEGISEFLPISSTGHMVLASSLLKLPETDFLKSFEIIIQFGAILAVLVLYWKKLLLNKETFIRVALAFIPTAIVGLVLYKFIKTVLLGNPWIVVWSLGIGGVLLILLEVTHKESADHKQNINDMSYMQAFLVGCAQSLSIIPGVSRSAATIVGALLLGVKRDPAVEFSFLLAIPTMAAATGLDFIKSGRHFTGNQYELLGIGLIGAFISALIVVKWFIGFVKKHTFIPFGVYRILVAVLYAFLVLR
ncbi:MAG TPA: undecaprenyl-diphosphate phosphatase [Patescibacteria group bacterium]|jgi:undecaprenyl-diphosphatase|nr:undecaprenyl-diphosphate phosphatase [Patescibacteria group bacterium]